MFRDVFDSCCVNERLGPHNRRTSSVDHSEHVPDVLLDRPVVELDDQVVPALWLICTIYTLPRAERQRSSILHDPILVEQSIIRNRSWRQDTDLAVGTFTDFFQDVCIDCLRDLIGDKALPLEEPVRAYHVPALFLFLPRPFQTIHALAIFTVELKVEYDLLFNITAQLDSIYLVRRSLIWSMNNVIIGFKGTE